MDIAEAGLVNESLVAGSFSHGWVFGVIPWELGHVARVAHSVGCVCLATASLWFCTTSCSSRWRRPIKRQERFFFPQKKIFLAGPLSFQMRAVVVIWALACLHETPCAAAFSSLIKPLAMPRLRGQVFSHSALRCKASSNGTIPPSSETTISRGQVEH